MPPLAFKNADGNSLFSRSDEQFVSTVGASLCQHHVHGGGAHHMLFAAVAKLQKVNALQKTFAAAKHRGRRDQMDFINQSRLQVLSHCGGAAADANVQLTGGFLGPL
jgi:hypothetical protein